MDLFISPHNDDAVLFGAFTLLRARPHVAVVYDSLIQPLRGYVGCDAGTRRAEDLAALQILGRTAELDVTFMGLEDDLALEMPEVLDSQLRVLETNFTQDQAPATVYVPHFEPGGHAHHNLVSIASQNVFIEQGWKVRRYLTYTDRGKSTEGERVAFEPDWPRLKLLALACYASQIRLSDNVDHFMRDQNEYLVG
jgi:LmbE family N-acetylglucosaminyl deacetylase